MNLSRKIINLAKNLNESLGDESTPEGSWENIFRDELIEFWLLPRYKKKLPKMPKAYIKIYNKIMDSGLPRIYEEETGKKFGSMADLIYGEETSVSDNFALLELGTLLSKYCDDD